MKKMATIVTSAVVVFGITGVGASLLTLSNPNTAPGTVTSEANCQDGTELTVTPVVDPATNVLVSYDVTDIAALCDGETLLVRQTLADGPDVNADPDIAWGFVTVDATSENLLWNAATGVFTDTVPTVTTGALVQAGDELAPPAVASVEEVRVTIAQKWTTLA